MIQRPTIEQLALKKLVLAVLGITCFAWEVTRYSPVNSQNLDTVLRQPPRYCPEDGGSGETLVRYVTESFYIYICQGGRRRDRNNPDNVLDYYSINRQNPHEFLRLPAFRGENEYEYYARNAIALYQIDPSQLTILENGKTLLTESIRSCITNDITLCDGTFLYDSEEGDAFEPFGQWPPRPSELKRFLGRNTQIVAQFLEDLDYSTIFRRDSTLGKMYVDTGRGILIFWFTLDTNESIYQVEFY
ncbi:MAG: hypothetical protein J7647_17035 [Cyanobacteria bacterium SBLK]|nr:hypothetical protein [Cyanobacteria bacterium SBLK]